MKLQHRLETECGASIELTTPNERDSIDGVRAEVIAAPHDEQAARTLVSWCGRENISFVARGGGTKIEIGAPPKRCDLIIDMRRLNQVVEHDEGNGTVAAFAGITLHDLNKHVSTQRQFVPLDGIETNATLGGMVASNHSGATRLRYGTPRDLVVGMNIALSDGRFVQAGSKVVKNVSGYDLNRIFTGSWGTLGLITRVTLRLRPNDSVSRHWQSTFSDWNGALETAREIRDGNFEPALLTLRCDDSGWHLQARFDGGETAVQTQLDRLPPSVEIEKQDAKSESETVRLRAALPLQSAANWARAARESGAHKVLWECASGVVMAHFGENCEVSTTQKLRELAERENGFMIVECAPTEWKTPDLVWGTPRSDWALMKRLKESFDSAKVCAPGRFVGGL